jgi:uncharacterized protein YukE
MWTESNLDFNKEGATQILTELREYTEKIKDIFDEVDFMMEAINGEDDTWKGKSQEAFYENFKTISGKFPTIAEDLDRQNDFLEETIENYQNRETHINKNIEDNTGDLNIN